jgi:hypothetical protein
VVPEEAGWQEPGGAIGRVAASLEGRKRGGGTPGGVWEQGAAVPWEKLSAGQGGSRDREWKDGLDGTEWGQWIESDARK